MSKFKTALCDHQWSRDDANSKVCVRCHARAEIREGDFR